MINFKKYILISCFALPISVVSYAQATLESAQEFVKNNDFANAKKAIDEVTQKEDKNAAAWFTKGYIYQKIAEDAKLQFNVPNSNVLALEAYKKFMANEKKLDITLVKENMLGLMGNFFNNAIIAYNGKKYSDAINNFDYALDVKAADASGKLFNNDKVVDTIIAQSKMYKAYSLFNDKKSSESLPLFEEAISSPITKDADLFLRLSVIHQNNNDNDKWISTLQKGISAYPTNSDLKNEEINYLILTNKTEELAKKLEEATIREPKNAQLFFSLATTYESLIKEQKTSDAEGTRKKAITAYEKAASLDSKTGDYVYNIGAMFFNQAVEANDQLNKNKDTKTLVESGKKTRDDLMKKSIPYLEKAMGVYENGSVKEADKLNYKNTLVALQKMYEILNMKTQKEGINKKLTSL
jgi:tetratricopeptide (TPR) repeat protein